MMFSYMACACGCFRFRAIPDADVPSFSPEKIGKGPMFISLNVEPATREG